MIDRAGLEIRYTPFGYRGFESLTFRTNDKESPKLGLSFVFFTQIDYESDGANYDLKATLQRQHSVPSVRTMRML